MTAVPLTRKRWWFAAAALAALLAVALYVALAMVVAGYFYGRMSFYPRAAVLMLVPLWSVIATYQWVRRQRDNGTLASVVAAGVPLSQLITATANHHAFGAVPP